MYSESADPWQLQSRWYERRKYAITLALLPYARYRHAFEPGCSIGVLTELLARRCDRVTATDVSVVALDVTHRRLVDAGCRERVTLLQASLDEPWPLTGCDLVVLSEVCYYLDPGVLRDGPGPRGAAVGAGRDRAGRTLAPPGRRLSDDR